MKCNNILQRKSNLQYGWMKTEGCKDYDYASKAAMVAPEAEAQFHT